MIWVSVCVLIRSDVAVLETEEASIILFTYKLGICVVNDRSIYLGHRYEIIITCSVIDRKLGFF